VREHLGYLRRIVSENEIKAIKKKVTVAVAVVKSRIPKTDNEIM
jgi:hypothetical protein